MYDFAPDPAAERDQLYADLLAAARAITAGEPDPVANMANLAALIWQFVPQLNWAGFYRVLPDAAGTPELVLGPFIGKPACIRIAWATGVCGTAAATAQTQLVPDVHAFPGHIACDAASRSELVVPVLRGGRVVAVIDCDSPELARFDLTDAARFEALARQIADCI